MSCPHCGRLTAAELVAAMDQLVCEETAITSPRCHCHDINGSMKTGFWPGEQNATAELLTDGERCERKRPLIDGVAQRGDGTLRTDKFLIAVEESATSFKAVSYVGQILRGRTHVHVHLLHVLPPIPPRFLEFGGAEQPQIEQRLSGELQQDQAQWIEIAKRNAQASLNKAQDILIQNGLSPAKVGTIFSSPIHRPDVANEILKMAQIWNCGTLVVGRHPRSWIRDLRSPHVGEDLIRKGQGFAIWVVE